MTSNEQMTYDYKMKWLGILKKIMFINVDTSKYAIFLFGSAVNNLVKAHDIDVGVLGPEKLPLEVKRDLYNFIEASIIPLNVDIVDFKEVSKGFKNLALKEIEIWNKPKNITLN